MMLMMIAASSSDERACQTPKKAINRCTHR